MYTIDYLAKILLNKSVTNADEDIEDRKALIVTNWSNVSKEISLLVTNMISKGSHVDAVLTALGDKLRYWARNVSSIAELTNYLAEISLRLLFHFQAVPLTKQLTHIAGNLWSSTLVCSRTFYGVT